MRNILNCLLLALILGNPVLAQKENWIDLFDGKTLNGWDQKGGKAIYSAKDGQILREFSGRESHRPLLTFV